MRVKQRFDLSRNELHLGPLPEVQRVLESTAAGFNRYPTDDQIARLVEQISALHEVPPAHVVVGAGSVGVLDALLHTRPQTDASTIFGTPTFDEYSALVSRAGGIGVAVPSDPPGTQALDAILSRVDGSTRQVIVAAPHNPTGTGVSIDELVRFRRALPKTALFIVDQAYAEFDTSTPADCLRRIVTELDDVVVLRSFSKAYGLAGLRIGYAVFSDAALAARTRAVIPTFSVSSIALCAATESLRQQRQLRQRVSDVIENRQRLESFLVRHDLFSGAASQGNFVWLPAEDPNALFRHALGDGILLREYPGLGVRITIQSDASVHAVLASLATFSTLPCHA
jgi:histidinol-phosphate aminotransferase